MHPEGPPLKGELHHDHHGHGPEDGAPHEFGDHSHHPLQGPVGCGGNTEGGGFWDWLSDWFRSAAPHRPPPTPDNLPTKLPGGGRDWLLNVDDGTIAAKHQPNLVLGREANPSMVLVKKGSPSQFVFDALPKIKDVDDPDATALLTLLSHPDLAVGTKYHDIKEDGPWRFIESGVVPHSNAVAVSFIDSNFLKLDDDRMDLVLDVAYWNMEEGSAVNFVGAPRDANEETYSSGGGRDWTIHEDGTVGCKHVPGLVLGLGPPRLVLVEHGSRDQLLFANLESLAKGEAAKLTLEGGGGVGKKYQDPKEAGPWRFIESKVGATDEAITVKYDGGNYIILEGEDLALDVSFWEMEVGNSVNFVGSSDMTGAGQGDPFEGAYSRNDHTSGAMPSSSSSVSGISGRFSSSSDSSDIALVEEEAETWNAYFDNPPFEDITNGPNNAPGEGTS